jgi:A/G-specific adenine glycosylase
MSLRSELLDWYLENRRDLPWRRSRDPYAIWISETMLQQTRVDTVIPYYERFLERFPTVEILADAEPDELMQQWAGLGYYSRARNLHAAAKTIAGEYGGELPDDVDALQSLKGIGRYTAGAVASIAFDRPAPILDGNVMRVLTRLHDDREDIRKPATQKRLWVEAEKLVAGPQPGDLNQALMELGAMICTPKSPTCLLCPIRKHCASRANGDPEKLPVKSKAVKQKKVEGVCVHLTRDSRILAARRPPEGLLGGLWELPGSDLGAREAPEEGLARGLRERVGLAAKDVVLMGKVKHVFTHRVLTLHVYRAEAMKGRVRRGGYDAHRWCTATALDALPFSTVAAKTLTVARGQGR